MLAQDLLIDFVVVHDQCPDSCQIDVGYGSILGWVQVQRERQGEGKGRSLVGLTGHFNRTVHQFHQLSGYGQAQSGAPEVPRGGGVCLGEFLEDVLEAFLRYAYAGVFNGYSETHGLFRLPFRLDVDQHLTLARKLDGIADQIGQHLADAAGIADKPHGHVRSIEYRQLDALALGRCGQRLRRFLDGNL